MRISDWSSDVCSSDLHRGGADPHRSALNCRRPTRLRSRVSGSSIELRGIEPGHRISTKNKDRDEKLAFQSTVKTVGTVSSLLFRLRLSALADRSRAFIRVSSAYRKSVVAGQSVIVRVDSVGGC